MTLAATNGLVLWPPPLVNNLSALGTWGAGIATLTFDSTTDRVAYVGHSPYADSISKIHFRVGTVTSAPNVDVRVETVDVATGQPARPSGTLWAANTNAVITIGASNTWQTATLTAAASLSLGSLFAINIVYSSGTANFLINRCAANAAGTGSWPMCLQDTGAGTWTQLASNLCMIIEFSSGGVMYVPGVSPVDSGSGIGGFNSGSSPDEYALQFRVPFKCRAIGMYFVSSNIASSANFTASLWPASSTVDGDALAQVALADQSVINTTQEGPMYLFFGSAVTLLPGTTYYVGVRADDATNSIDFYQQVAPGGITNAMRGFPIPTDGNTFRASRTWTAGSAGAWTNATTTLPLMGLIIDQLDDGAGGGGGMRLAGHGGLAS